MIPFFGCERDAQHNPHWTTIVDKILRSGRYLQGPYTEALEQAFMEDYQGKEAVAVGSCTDALFFALDSWVYPGEEVLIPDISFTATVSSVLRARAIPVFVDVDPETLLMDMDDALRKVTSKTSAFVLVHLFGNMAYDFRGIQELRKEGLSCIEDCAQAYGSYNGPIRSGTLGDMACFSFDPTKPVGGPGSGGMVVTLPEYACEIRRLRYHGKPEYMEIGYNSQMSEICAAVVLAKIESRQWDWRPQANLYLAELAGIPQIKMQRVQGTPAYSKFVVMTEHRDALAAYLSTKGVETRVHYPVPLHLLPMCCAGQSPLEHSSTVCEQILSLPLHFHLTEGEIMYVVGCIKEFFNGN